MTARTRFVQLALSKLGSAVLWGANGPEAFDCSGLVLWAMNAAGAKLPDQRAQDLADKCRLLGGEEGPLPGDLLFYGGGWGSVIHVGVWLAGGKALSADGATSAVKDLQAAKANERARVRLHDTPVFRRDYLGCSRNTLIDAVDKVEN